MRSNAGLAGLLVVLAITFGPQASAQPPPPACSVIVGGIPVNQLRTPESAGEVTQDLAISVEVLPEESATSPVIQIEEAGIRFTLSQTTVVEHRWSGAIQVQGYARWGVGLYKFRVDSLGVDDCEASFYLRVVGGSPMTTVAGVGALLALLSGLGLLAAATIGSRRRRRALSDLAWAEGRARWRPRVPYLGLVGGLAAAVGAIGLLQQYALVYPTRLIALTALLAGLAAGFALPLVSDVLAVHRVNRVAQAA